VFNGAADDAGSWASAGETLATAITTLATHTGIGKYGIKVR
jgi:hypothetical protein